MAHLLIVDDDERLRQLLGRFFRENGYDVTVAGNAEEAFAFCDYVRFDLAILDIMMPGASGIELATRWRAQGLTMPLLMLTAMGDVENRIQGLESGVDDYLAKPFDPQELLLRVRAILRRVPTPSGGAAPTMIGPYGVDWDRLLLTREGRTVQLTLGEAALLKILATHAGTSVSREILALETGAGTNLRAIDVQITRLRRKLEPDAKNPRYLQTVRNIGYILWTSE